MSTQVQICNMALNYLGHEAQIVSVSPPDGSREAELFSRLWTPSIEEIIAQHDWSFCTKVVSLAQLTVPPDHLYWKYAFDLPSDYVRAIGLYPDETHNDQAQYGARYFYDSLPFEVAIDPATNKQCLFANEPVVWLKYVFVNNETTTWPQIFSDAVSWLLAAKIAVPLLKDIKLQDYARKNYVYWLGEAMKYEMEQERALNAAIVDSVYPVGLNRNND